MRLRCKTAEWIEVLFEVETLGPRNIRPILERGPISLLRGAMEFYVAIAKLL